MVTGADTATCLEERFNVYHRTVCVCEAIVHLNEQENEGCSSDHIDHILRR